MIWVGYNRLQRLVVIPASTSPRFGVAPLIALSVSCLVLERPASSLHNATNPSPAVSGHCCCCRVPSSIWNLHRVPETSRSICSFPLQRTYSDRSRRSSDDKDLKYQVFLLKNGTRLSLLNAPYLQVESRYRQSCKTLLWWKSQVDSTTYQLIKVKPTRGPRLLL